MPTMWSFPAAFRVMIRVSCGSSAASRSTMATLSSSPRRCPRCGPLTAVSSWKPHSGRPASTATWVSAASSPVARSVATIT